MRWLLELATTLQALRSREIRDENSRSQDRSHHVLPMDVRGLATSAQRHPCTHGDGRPTIASSTRMRYTDRLESEALSQAWREAALE